MASLYWRGGEEISGQTVKINYKPPGMWIYQRRIHLDLLKNIHLDLFKKIHLSGSSFSAQFQKV
jgi:hypothetical protein